MSFRYFIARTRYAPLWKLHRPLLAVLINVDQFLILASLPHFFFSWNKSWTKKFTSRQFHKKCGDIINQEVRVLSRFADDLENARIYVLKLRTLERPWAMTLVKICAFIRKWLYMSAHLLIYMPAGTSAAKISKPVSFTSWFPITYPSSSCGRAHVQGISIRVAAHRSPCIIKGISAWSPLIVVALSDVYPNVPATCIAASRLAKSHHPGWRSSRLRTATLRKRNKYRWRGEISRVAFALRRHLEK